MKRDMELIRNILFYIEKHYQAGKGPIHIDLEGYTIEEIYEHCLLAYEAGLIKKPLDTSSLNQKSCMANSLTNAGFDYLETIRNDSIWKKTKETVKNKGLPLVINTIKTIANAFITASIEGVANSIIKNGGLI